MALRSRIPEENRCEIRLFAHPLSITVRHMQFHGRLILTWSLVLSVLPSLALAQQAAAPASPAALSMRANESFVVSQQTGVEVRGDFQVGPTRFIVELSPGEERTVETTITSREGEPRGYSISVEDFAISNDGNDSIQFYGNGSGPFSAKSWITPVVDHFSLNHGERAFLPIKISIPDNASVGDHYAVVLFQRNLKDLSKPGFNVIPRVGALLLITVKGDVIKHGILQDFNVSRPVYWSLPTHFGIQYANEGTVHIVPVGHIEIKNIFGIPVDDITVRDWYVLRNSIRHREVVWQPRFALGYYTATLTLNAEGQDAVQPMTVSFWVIPVLPVLLALLVIFAVSFFVQAFFSRFELRRKKG